MLLFAALPDEAAVRPKAGAVAQCDNQNDFPLPHRSLRTSFSSFVNRILQYVPARWILSERKGIKKPSRWTRRSSPILGPT
jgi:hypothetical protein